MPWQPEAKVFQEAFKPQPPALEPHDDSDGENRIPVAPTPRKDISQLLAIPQWRRQAFSLDKENMNNVLTIKPFEELLAIAYIRSVRHTVTKTGLSYLASYSGRHRSGKSVTASVMAHMWDRTFWKYFEQRVVQSPREFVGAMETVIRDNIMGAALVIDEAGATMASADWYERWIKAIQKTLQICGMLRPMILFVAPNREYIMSGMRKLIVAEHYFERHNTDYTNMNVYHVKYSTMRHDYYYKKPMVRIAGQTVQLKRILFHIPPQYFVDRYKALTEPHKLDMMSQLGEEVKRSLVDKTEDKEPDYDTIIEEIFQKRDVFVKDKLGKGGYPVADPIQVEIHYKLRQKFAKYVCERVNARIKDHMDENLEEGLILKERLEFDEKKRTEQETKARFRNLRDAPAGKLEGSERMKALRTAEKGQLEEMDEELKTVLTSL